MRKDSVAIIDLGTNTFHLLIAEITSNVNFRQLYKTKTVVKLLNVEAREGFPITPELMTKAIQTIDEFYDKIKQFNVNRIVCFATSAIRSASNGNDLIEAIKKNTGIKTKIISGIEEAKLIYNGVRQALKIGKEKSLIMDIGGGSVEFIIADESKIYLAESYNIGGARLKKKFHQGDIITSEEIQKLTSYLADILKEMLLKAQEYNINTIIGSSGSFDTFIDMAYHQFLKKKTSNKSTEHELALNHFKKIHIQLIQSTYNERVKIKGMKEFRADMIVAASVLTNFVIEQANIQRIRVSSYALKEGVLWNEVKRFAKKKFENI